MGVQCFIIYLCAVYLKLHTYSFHSSHIGGYEGLLWIDVHTKSYENPSICAHIISGMATDTCIHTNCTVSIYFLIK